MFERFKGGQQPITGISEAGARIGQMTASGLSTIGAGIAEGLKEYSKLTQAAKKEAGETMSKAAARAAIDAVSPTETTEVDIKLDLPPWAGGSINDYKAKFNEAYDRKVAESGKRAALAGVKPPRFISREAAWARVLSEKASVVAKTPGTMLTQAQRDGILAGLADQQSGLFAEAADSSGGALMEWMTQPETENPEEFLGQMDRVFGAIDRAEDIQSAPKIARPKTEGIKTLAPEQDIKEFLAPPKALSEAEIAKMSPEQKAAYDAAMKLSAQYRDGNFVYPKLTSKPVVTITSTYGPTGQPTNTRDLTSNPIFSDDINTAQKVIDAMKGGEGAFAVTYISKMLAHLESENGLSPTQARTAVAKMIAEAEGLNIKAIEAVLQQRMRNASPDDYNRALHSAIMDELAKAEANEREKSGGKAFRSKPEAVVGAVADNWELGAYAGGAYAVYKAYRAIDESTMKAAVEAEKRGILELKRLRGGRIGRAADAIGPSEPMRFETSEETRARLEDDALNAELKKKKITRAEFDALPQDKKERVLKGVREAVDDEILKKGGLGRFRNFIRKSNLGKVGEAAVKVGAVLGAGWAAWEAGKETVRQIDPAVAMRDDFIALFENGGEGAKAMLSEAQAHIAKGDEVAKRAAEAAQKGIGTLKPDETLPSVPFGVKPPAIASVGIGMVPQRKEPSRYSKEIVNYVRNIYPDADMDVVEHVMRSLQPQYSFVTDHETGARFVMTRDEKGNAKLQQINPVGDKEDAGRVIGQEIRGDDGRLMGYAPLEIGGIRVMGRFSTAVGAAEQKQVVNQLMNYGRAAQALHELKILYTTYGEEVTGEVAGAMEARSNQLVATLRTALGDVGNLTQYDVERIIAQIPTPSGWGSIITIDRNRAKFANLESYLRGTISSTAGMYGMSIEYSPKDVPLKEIITGRTYSSESGPNDFKSSVSENRMIWNLGR